MDVSSYRDVDETTAEDGEYFTALHSKSNSAKVLYSPGQRTALSMLR